MEKFHLIANEIEKAGGAKYPTVFIAKEIKKMEKTTTDPATTGGDDMNDFGQDLQEWSLTYNQSLSFGSDFCISTYAYQSS